MEERTPLDELRQGLAHQDRDVGPGAWSPLIRTLRTLADEEPSPLADLAEVLARGPAASPSERPMHLLAGLRYRALTTREQNDDHVLTPELLADARAPDLTSRLRTALADAELPAALAHHDRGTTEPARAIGWGMVALGAGLPHRGFALVDMGCGDGLHLVGDLVPCRWDVAQQRIGGLDLPSPGRRLGLDRAPTDPTAPERVRWMRAGIWATDTVRRRDLEAALEGLDRSWPDPAEAPTVRPHVLGRDDTVELLEAVEAERGLPVLAVQSLVAEELDETEAAAHDAAMDRWLARGDRRLHVRLEPAPNARRPEGELALTLRYDAGDGPAELEVGRTARRPDGLRTASGALAELRALGERLRGEGA